MYCCSPTPLPPPPYTHIKTLRKYIQLCSNAYGRLKCVYLLWASRSYSSSLASQPASGAPRPMYITANTSNLVFLIYCKYLSRKLVFPLTHSERFSHGMPACLPVIISIIIIIISIIINDIFKRIRAPIKGVEYPSRSVFASQFSAVASFFDALSLSLSSSNFLFPSLLSARRSAASTWTSRGPRRITVKGPMAASPIIYSSTNLLIQ